MTGSFRNSWDVLILFILTHEFLFTKCQHQDSILRTFLEQLIIVVADVDPKSIVLHQKTNQIVLLSDNTGCFAGILMQNIWLKIPAENLEGIEIDDGNTWLM